MWGWRSEGTESPLKSSDEPALSWGGSLNRSPLPIPLKGWFRGEGPHPGPTVTPVMPALHITAESWPFRNTSFPLLSLIPRKLRPWPNRAGALSSAIQAYAIGVIQTSILQVRHKRPFRRPLLGYFLTSIQDMGQTSWHPRPAPQPSGRGPVKGDTPSSLHAPVACCVPWGTKRGRSTVLATGRESQLGPWWWPPHFLALWVAAALAPYAGFRLPRWR